MFRDNTPTFPDDKLILGRYLGPVTDIVGLALTAKILKSNGQVVYRSTLRHLSDDERARPVHIANRKAFDDSIAERLGPAAREDDFPAQDLTPEYEPFGDIVNADSGLKPDQEDLEVTPKAHDNYVDIDLFIPKGGTMSRGHVTARKRDAYGNPKGRANDNPILDTREYTVTFEDGDVTELTANLIAESMYAECDLDGNQYVLLDSIIDHQRRDTTLRLSDQTVVCSDNRTYVKHNTVGWQICCQWRDSSSSWERSSDLK